MISILGLTLLGNNMNAQNISKEELLKDANVYKYSVKNIKKEDVSLKNYEGKVLLIVNVASECGYTPQYEGLEKIYEKYHAKGFEVLAFPCNDFGGQEPGTNEEIQKFCSTKFSVTFPLFDKISVKDDQKADLYKMLTDNSVTGKSEISWNFEKFLVDRKGHVVKNFKSKVKPESEELTSEIEKLLN
ncbi:MAG: glutathione peroxidase [Bacteroidetes bacterium]|nr:glutathione peroxidase [Bacteroidota bacterium]MBU1115671.1 glutathione peroxidase [Bacteroidota bacterium]MBU1799016.1 glutathione peroxidase [Bacteroidota bacterium]